MWKDTILFRLKIYLFVGYGVWAFVLIAVLVGDRLVGAVRVGVVRVPLRHVEQRPEPFGLKDQFGTGLILRLHHLSWPEPAGDLRLARLER